MLKVVGETFREEGLGDTLIYGPEHMTFDMWGNRRVLDALQKNGALQYLDVFASHGYTNGIQEDVSKDSSAAMWSLIEPYRRPYWVTEGGTGGHAWPAPLSGIGAMLHNALVHGHASAVVTWQITDSDPTEHDLMVGETPDKKTAVAEQYFRFVRPGAVRVAATPSDGPVAASAFVHPKDGTLTVALINAGPTARAVTLHLRRVPSVAVLRAYRTSAGDSLRRLPDTPVRGGVVSLTLPAESIVTLSGQAERAGRRRQPGGSQPAR